jgi:hypothetical protein
VRQHRGAKFGRHLAVEQPVPVLGGGSWWRFLVKVVASHTRSSMPRPTNQRNKRSVSIRSTNCRSGGIGSRPIGEYKASKSRDSDFSDAFAISRITRNR